MQYDHASIFSKVTYEWLNPKIWDKDPNAIIKELMPVESIMIENNYK